MKHLIIVSIVLSSVILFGKNVPPRGRYVIPLLPPVLRSVSMQEAQPEKQNYSTAYEIGFTLLATPAQERLNFLGALWYPGLSVGVSHFWKPNWSTNYHLSFLFSKESEEIITLQHWLIGFDVSTNWRFFKTKDFQFELGPILYLMSEWVTIRSGKQSLTSNADLFFRTGLNLKVIYKISKDLSIFAAPDLTVEPRGSLRWYTSFKLGILLP